MSDYTPNADYDDVARMLRTASSVLIATHSKPDGDAIGSVLALQRSCEQLGIESEAVLMGPVADNLRAFAGETPLTLLGDEGALTGEPEVIIVCDTGATSQLDPIADWLTARLEKIIVIDHHVNGDLIAPARLIDVTAASATLVIFELLPHLGVAIDGGAFSIAEALLLGLATDTGWFKFNSADARAFRAAAALIEAGADKARIHAAVEENDRPARFALMARALGSLELIGNGQAALMSLRPTDFAETGASTDDLVAIVNQPLSIGSVRLAVLLSSVEPNQTKMSFRSKPPLETRNGRVRAVDVNRIAMQFGGGGHVHAAGARVDLPIDQARAAVSKALDAELSTEAR